MSNRVSIIDIENRVTPEISEGVEGIFDDYNATDDEREGSVVNFVQRQEGCTPFRAGAIVSEKINGNAKNGDIEAMMLIPMSQTRRVGGRRLSNREVAKILKQEAGA